MDIHPLIAHFPIVLLVIGVVCDAIGILNDRDFFLRAGFLLFSLGAVTAIPVALTGDSAAEVAQHIDGIAADLEDHDTLGTVTAFLAVALALVRTHFVLKKKFVGLFAMCISFLVLLLRVWCARRDIRVDIWFIFTALEQSQSRRRLSRKSACRESINLRAGRDNADLSQKSAQYSGGAEKASAGYFRDSIACQTGR